MKIHYALLQALGYDVTNIALLTPTELDFSRLGTECVSIDSTENRGISRAQLGLLRDFLESHANSSGWLNGWTDLAPPEYSTTSGHRLNVNTINLYQVCHRCVCLLAAVTQ